MQEMDVLIIRIIIAFSLRDLMIKNPYHLA